MEYNVSIYDSFKEMLDDTVKKYGIINAFSFFEKNDINHITYKEFYLLVENKISEFKKEKSLVKAIIGPTSIDLLVNFFASVISGKTTLLIDPILPLEIILAQLKIAKVTSISFDENYFDKEETIKIKKSLPLINSEENNNNSEGDIIFFTSGTTSLSKGVVLSSKSLLRAAYNGQSRLACKVGDVLLSSLPLSHVFGFVCTLLWPLCNGATTAISRGLKYIPQDLSLFKTTILPQVPSAIQMLLKINAFNKELKTILIGAGPIDYETIKAINSLNIDVSFGYGLTETSSGVAISVNKEDPYAMELCPDTICKISETGEILLKTPSMMKGYYNDSLSTSKAFIDGFLRTNDIGYLDQENCLHVTGRLNDVIVLKNGLKINLEELEIQLKPFLNNIDFALIYIDDKLKLFYFDKDNLFDLGYISKCIECFNKTLPMGQAINSIQKLEHSIFRTLTGKIIRYRLVETYGKKV